MSTIDATKKYRKTKKGVVTNIYDKMRSRHKAKGFTDPIISLCELQNLSNCVQFDRMYLEWVNSGYRKSFKPTIDRINNKKGYSKENIHWLQWSDNRYKQNMERRNRSLPVAKILDGAIVEVFKSQRDAIKKNDIKQGNMSLVLGNKRKSCMGYQWRYISIEEYNIHQHPHLLTQK